MLASVVLLLDFPECDDYIGAGDRHEKERAGTSGKMLTTGESRQRANTSASFQELLAFETKNKDGVGSDSGGGEGVPGKTFLRG